MLKFELTLEEINLIGTALGKLPFETVEALIVKLRAQASGQMVKRESPVAE
jgi:hypothetical protein